MAINQGQAGPQKISDGALGIARLGRLGDTIISELQGKYGELTSRGQVFVFGAAAVTYAATGNTPLAAGTGVPVVGILNPANSTVNCQILGVWIVTTSGTPGGPFYWNGIPNPTGITAAGSTAISLLTFNAAGSVTKAFANAALTGSAAATYLRPIGGPAASAVGAGLYGVAEDTNGSIVVQPGAFAGVAGTAVGSSHVISSGMIWAEIPQ